MKIIEDDPELGDIGDYVGPRDVVMTFFFLSVVTGLIAGIGAGVIELMQMVVK